MTIQVLLADDHKIVRDGLRVLIERCHDMQVVAEAEDGRKAASVGPQAQTGHRHHGHQYARLERHRRHAPDFGRGARARR